MATAFFQWRVLPRGIPVRRGLPFRIAVRPLTTLTAVCVACLTVTLVAVPGAMEPGSQAVWMQQFAWVGLGVWVLTWLR